MKNTKIPSLITKEVFIMHILQTCICTIHTTDHVMFNHVRDQRLLLRGFFSRRRLWKKVVRRYGQSMHLPARPMILCAHGKIRKRQWHFRDTQRGIYQSVQGWIDEHDGEAAALFVFCCNTLNAEIHAQRSLVIHLNRPASLWDLWHGGRLRLLHPGFGYIENNYYRLHQILRR